MQGLVISYIEPKGNDPFFEETLLEVGWEN